MEPYAAKTLLKNLSEEHNLTPDTLRTDRSSAMKTMIRLLKKKMVCFNCIFNHSELNEELPEDDPKICHLYDIWHWIKVSVFTI